MKPVSGSGDKLPKPSLPTQSAKEARAADLGALSRLPAGSETAAPRLGSRAGLGILALHSQTWLRPKAAGPTTPVPSLPATVSEHLKALGLPGDRAAHLAVLALQAESLPLGQESIRQVRSFCRRFRDAPAAAALSARALAAGQDDEAMLVQAVEAFIGDHQGSGRGSQADSEGQASGGSGGTPARGGLAGRLRRECNLFLGQSDFRKLFQPGPDGRAWLYIPFNFVQDGLDFRGMLRILFNYNKVETEKVVAELVVGDDALTCSLTGSGAKKRLRLLDTAVFPPERAKAFLAAIKESCAGLCIVADGMEPDPSMQSVDQHV